MSDRIDDLATALAGRYEIERELGQGGMATVYLAEDPKHRRKVAVKVLRPELAAALGAERFLAEIQVTANLQHPNILPLYDSGQADAFLYYVMPYIEGESLRDTLDREKQLSVERTIEIAKAVAAALAFAHGRGVLHRDIKPENILLQEGQALVADFGIALAVSHLEGPRLTETGLSLGTPQYMSPEQATGDREIDARSDVYSLGAVVYEMLVGEPPYAGPTVQAIVMRILSEEPRPIRLIRAAVPPNVEEAVLTALAQTPADRFAGTAEFAAALTDPGYRRPETGRLAATTPWALRRGLTSLLATAFVVALAFAWYGWFRPAPPTHVARLQVTLPEDQRLSVLGQGAYPIALSHDGTRLVFVAEQGGVRRLMVRDMDEFDARPLEGTENARQPFFSPDGQWVGFFAGGQLHRVAVAGGGPIAVAPMRGQPWGATWGDDPDGTILFSTGDSLYRVPFSGGDPVALNVAMAVDGQTLGADSTANLAGSPHWPHFLPGATHALVSVPVGTGVLELATGAFHYLFSGVQARYSSGHLVFNAGQERVRTVPFDLGRLEITGPEAPAVDDVFRGPGGGAVSFAVSDNGTLVYLAGGFERTVWLVDRDGRESPVPIEARGYRWPRISPDGNRLVVVVDPRPSELWLVDLGRSSAVPLRTTGHHVTPAWTPDGDRVVFDNDGDIHVLHWRQGGDPERLARRPRAQYLPEWSVDDRILVHETAPETGLDLIELDPSDGSSAAFLVTAANEWLGTFSPNGRWVAYSSDVSGVDEVYVLSASGEGQRHTISVGGGTEPRWSRDGTELFYRAGTGIWAVDVRVGMDFRAGPPRLLFAADQFDFGQSLNWDVGPDGRFVMVKGDPTALRRLQVVLNWDEELPGD
jgi:serine/threonine-protein kinase